MTTLNKVENLKEALAVCVKHADELIEAARLLFANGKNNFAFHMGVLCLEEIGKFEIYQLSALQDAQAAPTYFEKWSDNHEKKLFYALWMPGKIDTSAEQFLEARRVAKETHTLRLDSIYTRTTKQTICSPHAIPKQVCTSIIGYSEERIKILKNMIIQAPQQEYTELQNWFLTATDDKQKSAFIFSAESMKELQKMNEVTTWVRWVRKELQDAKAKSDEILRSELSKDQTVGFEGSVRWRFRIRLYTTTNSIRPKPLTWWNSKFSVIQLKEVTNKKDCLDIQINLSENLKITETYEAAFAFFNHFLLSINIGSFGFFWRALPYDQEQFFDDVTDVQQPNLKMILLNKELCFSETLFRKNALDQVDIERIANCFSYILRFKTEKLCGVFKAYRSGLNFLGVTNVHGDYRIAAFQEFHRSFKLAALEYGKIMEEKDFARFFTERLSKKTYTKSINFEDYVQIVSAL